MGNQGELDGVLLTVDWCLVVAGHGEWRTVAESKVPVRNSEVLERDSTQERRRPPNLGPGEPHWTLAASTVALGSRFRCGGGTLSLLWRWWRSVVARKR